MRHGRPQTTYWIVSALLALAVLLLAGCGPADENGEGQNEETPAAATSPASYPAPVAPREGYPPPEEPVAEPVSPTRNPYPGPGDEGEGTLLALNKPIGAGDGTVTGVGPAGLPVFIINITLAGERATSGVVGADGTFSIPVDFLEANTRIGLTAEVEGTDFVVRPGDGALNVPMVGYFYDTALVQP